MALKVAINGFGRIGRTVFRIGQGRQEIDFVAINDLADIAELAHLLKYDSVHGVFGHEVAIRGNELVVRGKKTAIYSTAEPDRLPWGQIGVDIVLECTGGFTNGRDAAGHLRAGAKKVIVSAPADGADVTVIPGVNDDALNLNEHRVISMGSCTANCLAPILAVLDGEYGIVSGFMTTVHAYTKDQPLVDSVHRDLRRGRAAGLSMVPTTTGAFKAIFKVMPHLEDRINGISIRVPTPNVSLVDLVVTTRREVDRKGINRVFMEYADGPLEGILSCEEESLVSCDFNGNGSSAVIDLPSTQVIDGHTANIVAWYDNECGFSNRLIDLMLAAVDTKFQESHLCQPVSFSPGIRLRSGLRSGLAGPTHDDKSNHGLDSDEGRHTYG
ncbi:MAG TPA: type I glyceraldehyde-3-phosphate dehydrogenase [Deltaproteobacteria bacterium]|nr:type I glyceraldehyde-3-phosphate dehydrogenase [Deltaproteobacteria bacterium]